MTNIDASTGLPSLPEGHFWRVEKTFVEIRKSLPDTEWRTVGYPSEVYWNNGPFEETQERRSVDAVDTRVETVWRWFRKVEVTTNTPTLVHQERYVDRSEKVVRVLTEPSGDTITIQGGMRAIHRSSYLSPYAYGYEREPDTVRPIRQPVTKANIILLCEKALEEFDALSLIGTYPPKKFESEGN